MAVEKNEVVKLAIDYIKGDVPTQYTKKQTSDSLIDSLIELNGGTDKINIKTFHRGNAVFDIIEEIIPTIVEEGFKGTEFFMDLVDYRNVNDGDSIEFLVENPSTFIVADISNGVQSVRRQRLDAGTKQTINTTLKAVKVYEDLKRLLAKKTDFSIFVKKVGEAFSKKIYNDVYAAFNGISAATVGLNDKYVITGTYSEDALMELIDHVEAATGKTARIVGTKTALRKVTTAVVSNDAKADLYNIGYYGKFNGTDMISVKQLHVAGTDTFAFDNTKIYIIASDDKPVKVVNEGEGLLVTNDSITNADLTQEYLYAQAYGVGVVIGAKLGIMNVG